MASLTQEQARAVIGNIPLLSKLAKKEPTQKDVEVGIIKPLNSAVSSMQGIAKNLGYIVSYMKSNIDLRKAAENKQRYQEEEALREAQAANKEEVVSKIKLSSIQITPTEFFKKIFTSPLLAAAVGAVAYNLIPEEKRTQLKNYGRTILSKLGVTDRALDTFRDALSIAAKALKMYLGMHIAGLVINAIASIVTAVALIQRLVKRIGMFGLLSVIAGSSILALNKVQEEIKSIRSELGMGETGNVDEKGAYAESGTEKEAMDFFQSRGWTKEQSAGIVGNLVVESNLKTNALGDNGMAYGIAQWHPDRQERFKQVYGKDIRESSFKEQLEYVDWELNNSESKAGNALRQASTAPQAAEIVDRMYERSAGLHTERRITTAKRLEAGEYGAVAKVNQKSTSELSELVNKNRDIEENNRKASSNLSNIKGALGISDMGEEVARKSEDTNETARSVAEVMITKNMTQRNMSETTMPSVDIPIPSPIGSRGTLDLGLFYSAV